MTSISLCLLTLMLFCCIATNNANSANEREEELKLANRILDILQEDDAKRMNNNNNNNQYPDVTPAVLVEEGAKNGIKALNEDYELKYKHFADGIDTHTTSAEGAVAYTDYTPTEAEEQDNKTTVAHVALAYILETMDITLEELREGNHPYKRGVLQEWKNKFHPEEYHECTDAEKRAKFRSIDGSCNNVDHPEWGKSITARDRFIPKPSFGDKHGLNGLRKAKNGGDLPSARHVSIELSRHVDNLTITPFDTERTVALTGWGQFTDHELTDTALSSGYDGAVIACCSLSEEERKARLQCIDIDIAADDPAFTDASCMECVRSAGILTDFGVPGYRQQINDITAFIDGSSTYGSDHERADEIWDPSTGKLIEKRPGFPPEDTDADACVKNFATTMLPYYCPKAGDRRSSDISHLTVFHVLFLRVHNDLVMRLDDMNPLWDGKRLYEEARRIVGALLQHITYDEWLPRFLGKDLMDEHKLWSGNTYIYDDKLNPSVTAEFATAALRVGHSLVTPFMRQMDQMRQVVDEKLNREAFLDPFLTFKGPSEVMRWMITAPGQESDRFVNIEFLDHLFENLDNTTHLDLISINIQRGRDHGLASYADYHEECGLGTIEDWDDLIHHTDSAKEALQKAYDGYTVRDIDLYAGALSETHASADGHLGPTFACIFVDQFKRVKFGDRFWYENKSSPNIFTKKQIKAIKNVKLSALICKHYHLNEAQEDAFSVPVDDDLVDCSTLRDISLEAWKDT